MPIFRMWSYQVIGLASAFVRLCLSFALPGGWGVSVRGGSSRHRREGHNHAFHRLAGVYQDRTDNPPSTWKISVRLLPRKITCCGWPGRINLGKRAICNSCCREILSILRWYSTINRLWPLIVWGDETKQMKQFRPKLRDWFRKNQMSKGGRRAFLKLLPARRRGGTRRKTTTTNEVGREFRIPTVTV